MSIYFVYTPNHIPNIGGIHPQHEDITVGLGSYGPIHSGKASSEIALLAISEFTPVITTKNAIEGLKFIGIDEVLETLDEPGHEITTRGLNDDEKASKTAAEELVSRLISRMTVAANIDYNTESIENLEARLSALEAKSK